MPEGFDVLPTFLCRVCGWLAGTDDSDHVYCNNPKCSQRGKLFSIEFVITEIEGAKI